MKKLLLTAFVACTMSLSSFAFFINCRSGNEAMTVMDPEGGIGEACCVEVGDGTELSCTSDNRRWFNVSQIVIEA